MINILIRIATTAAILITVLIVFNFHIEWVSYFIGVAVVVVDNIIGELQK